ncbi:hypothetical protein BJ912DRAFT_964139 [Pholiota molesta]|nr:hypothetical protein BJ912DRAFT_964139 [Pholiota molesta]
MSSNKPTAAAQTTVRGDQRARPPLPSRMVNTPNRPRQPNTLDGYVVPPVYTGPTPPSRSGPSLVAHKAPVNRNATPAKHANTPLSVAAKTGRPQGGSSSRSDAASPRVRFAQGSHPTTSARINPSSSSQGPRRQPDAPQPVNTKSTVELKPLWQQLDEEHEQQILRIKKRDRGGNAVAFVRRIGQRGGPAGGVAPGDVNMADGIRDRAEIAPALRLRVNGTLQYSSSDEDEPRYKPLRKTIGTKITSAARKVEYTNASTSESDESSKTKSNSSSSSEEEEREQPPSPKSESDIEMDESVQEIPDIVLLDYPRRASPVPDRQLVDPQAEPPAGLIAAVEALTLSAIRMQKTKQLPFLLRNLRHGFLKRCRKLQVPVFTDGRKVSLELVYEHVAGVRYETRIEAWCCPLCDLLGMVKTQEMLECHLRWDHAEVFCEWQKKEETEEIEYWELRLLIPEINEAVESDLPKTEVSALATPENPPTPQVPSTSFITPNTRRLMSPFPSVSLSPPAPRAIDTPLFLLPKIEFKLEPTPSTAPPSSRSTSAFDLSSTSGTGTRSISTATSRSHTGLSVASTATTQRPPRSSTGGAITPPPPDKPLGPAAQPPYLPAKSDYGGPTVYYSCRPTGPSVFDLLGTLPMEKFGVLDWDVIDREEEIWESDDVREEYKVMQALWMRWIMLNRNKFISNYYKGAIAFVDEYWKIIHRAAGWDALRYWLFILLANRFLDGRDMAKVLRHYEELTGMDNWYD